MTHTTRREWMAALGTAVLVSAAGLGAQAVDLTGDWIFNVTTGAGSGTPAITFKQAGEKLTGTYNGQLGNTTFTGSIKGNAFDFTFTTDAQGQTVDVVYRGTVEKDEVKGSVAIAGGQVSGSFTGARKTK